MADRSRPVKLYLTSDLQVSCASNRRYAVVQIVWDQKRKGGRGGYRAKVMFRSDNPTYIGEWIRRQREYSYVYELNGGRALWENTPSEWRTCVQRLQEHDVEIRS